MNPLKLFQSKNAQINNAPAVAAITATPTGTKPSAAPAPSNRAVSHANPDAAAAVKSVLAAFAEEATEDARKIDLITRQLMDTQHALLNAAGPHEANKANANATEQIKAILGSLHALHSECKATATQLQQMGR